MEDTVSINRIPRTRGRCVGESADADYETKVGSFKYIDFLSEGGILAYHIGASLGSYSGSCVDIFETCLE